MPAPRVKTNNKGLQQYLDALADHIDSLSGNAEGVDMLPGGDFTFTDNGGGDMTLDWLPSSKEVFFLWRLTPVADKMYVYLPGHVHIKYARDDVYEAYPARIEEFESWRSIFGYEDGEQVTPPAHSLPLSANENYTHWLVVDPHAQDEEAKLYNILSSEDIALVAEVDYKRDIHIFKLAQYDTDEDGYPEFNYYSWKLRSEPTICCEADSSSGASKDTAIVPVDFYSTGYAALYCLESPAVEFVDTTQRTLKKGRRVQEFKIDTRFVKVNEPDLFRVVGSGDKGWAGFEIVDNGWVRVTTSWLPWLRPKNVTYTITGVRKGYPNTRYGPRTREQFIANNLRLENAYKTTGERPD